MFFPVVLDIDDVQSTPEIYQMSLPRTAASVVAIADLILIAGNYCLMKFCLFFRFVFNATFYDIHNIGGRSDIGVNATYHSSVEIFNVHYLIVIGFYFVFYNFVLIVLITDHFETIRVTTRKHHCS